MTNDECRTADDSFGLAEHRPADAREPLLDDLKRGALSVPRGRAGQERADRLNRLTVAADDSAYVRLTQLHPEDRRLSGRDLREHHFIRKLDELANDEFEKLFHDWETIPPSAQAASSLPRSGGLQTAVGKKRGLESTPP